MHLSWSSRLSHHNPTLRRLGNFYSHQVGQASPSPLMSFCTPSVFSLLFVQTHAEKMSISEAYLQIKIPCGWKFLTCYCNKDNCHFPHYCKDTCAKLGIKYVLKHSHSSHTLRKIYWLSSSHAKFLCAGTTIMFEHSVWIIQAPTNVPLKRISACFAWVWSNVVNIELKAWTSKASVKTYSISWCCCFHL